ncbi:MAG: glycosyltransferase family A protein [Candidatus Nanopelagicales bacterium]
MLAVSVVVPVFNPGARLRPALESLDSQGAFEFEVILVDDGSTDNTPDILRAFASTRPHVSVTRIPNSGWPGRPRNVGTDLARGQYVVYMDHDDALPPNSLQEWYEYARDNKADICVGKESRPGGVSPGLGLFRADLQQASVARDNLFLVATPHKMYRRSFLVEHDLHFPEGKTRLEDHHLNVRAFHRAQRICLLSSKVVYVWIKPVEGSNSSGFGSLETYFGALQGLLDLIDEEWPEGPDRDSILMRWWTFKDLYYVSSTMFAQWSASFQSELVDTLAEVDVRFPDRLRDSLQPVSRLQSYLVRARDTASLVAIAKTQSRLRAAAQVTSTRWRKGVLEVGIDLTFHDVDAQPMTEWEPADATRGQTSGDLIEWCASDQGEVPDALGLTTSIAQELAAANGLVVLRDLATGEDWPIPTVLEPAEAVLAGGRSSRWLRLIAHVDPRAARAGRAMADGKYELWVNLEVFGRTFRPWVLGGAPRRDALIDEGQVRVARARSGRLRVSTGEAGRPVWENKAAKWEATRIESGPRVSKVLIPVKSLHVDGPVARPVELTYAGARLPATLQGDGHRAVYSLRLPHIRVLRGLRARADDVGGLIALPREGKAPLALVRLTRRGMSLAAEAPD